MILNFKRARLGPQLCPGHERTAKSQTKLEAASSTPLTALGISQHRELKTPGGGGNKIKKNGVTRGKQLECFFCSQLQLAWLGVPGHRYGVTGSEMSQESHLSSKVRAEMNANAGGALCVVWRWTQVRQAFLLQAAGVAAGFGGGVVA